MSGRHSSPHLGAAILFVAVGTLALTWLAPLLADPRPLFTCVAVLVFACTAMEGMTLARRSGDPLAALGALTVPVSALALVAMVGALWTMEFEGDDINPWAQPAWIGFAVSVALGHISLLLAGRRPTDARAATALMSAAIGLTVGLAVLFSIVVVAPGGEVGARFWPFMEGVAILTLFATLVTWGARR